MFNEESSQEPKRLREIKEDAYLPKGLLNAYLDDRMKLSEKKKFEQKLAGLDIVQEELRIKTQKKQFVSELIPHPMISKNSQGTLKVELEEITDSVIGDEKKTFSDRLVSFLDKTILEF